MCILVAPVNPVALGRIPPAPGNYDAAVVADREAAYWAILITSGGNFARTAGFAVALTAGTKATGVVRRDQPRALDLRARGARKLESLPASIMDEVLARLASIFE